MDRVSYNAVFIMGIDKCIICIHAFSHSPHYLFSVNGLRHFFSVNPSPIFIMTFLFSPYTLSWTL